MSPSHGNKNRSRRYRYYVSQAVLKYQDKEAGSITRIAAHTIEALVIDELLGLLQDDLRLLALTDAQGMSLDQRSALLTKAKRLARQWKEMKEHDQLTIMNKIVKRVTVGRQQVTLTFSKIGSLQQLGYESAFTHESDDIEIKLAVSLQRCGIESKLIVEGKPSGPAHTRTIKALQEALKKALKWNEALISGKHASMHALAKEQGISPQYVGHIIKLAWLSPDIIRAILKGQVPATLSLDQLKKGFPLDWDEQRKVLGFSA
jgi:hypothetical protein